MLERGDVGTMGGVVAVATGDKPGNEGACKADKAAAAAIESMGVLVAALRGAADSGNKGVGSADTTTEGGGATGTGETGMLGNGDVGNTVGNVGAEKLLPEGLVGDTGDVDTGMARGYERTLGSSVDDVGEILPVEAERPLVGMDAGESVCEAAVMGSVAVRPAAVGIGRDALIGTSLVGDVLMDSGAAKSLGEAEVVYVFIGPIDVPGTGDREGREPKRASCGMDARTLANRRSKSLLPAEDASSALALRSFLPRRWAPGRLPPPLPRLGGT